MRMGEDIGAAFGKGTNPVSGLKYECETMKIISLC